MFVFILLRSQNDPSTNFINSLTERDGYNKYIFPSNLTDKRSFISQFKKNRIFYSTKIDNSFQRIKPTQQLLIFLHFKAESKPCLPLS